MLPRTTAQDALAMFMGSTFRFTNNIYCETELKLGLSRTRMLGIIRLHGGLLRVVKSRRP